MNNLAEKRRQTAKIRKNVDDIFERRNRYKAESASTKGTSLGDSTNDSTRKTGSLPKRMYNGLIDSVEKMVFGTSSTANDKIDSAKFSSSTTTKNSTLATTKKIPLPNASPTATTETTAEKHTASDEYEPLLDKTECELARDSKSCTDSSAGEKKHEFYYYYEDVDYNGCDESFQYERIWPVWSLFKKTPTRRKRLEYSDEDDALCTSGIFGSCLGTGRSKNNLEQSNNKKTNIVSTADAGAKSSSHCYVVTKCLTLFLSIFLILMYADLTMSAGGIGGANTRSVVFVRRIRSEASNALRKLVNVIDPEKMGSGSTLISLIVKMMPN